MSDILKCLPALLLMSMPVSANIERAVSCVHVNFYISNHTPRILIIETTGKVENTEFFRLDESVSDDELEVFHEKLQDATRKRHCGV